MNLAKEVDKIGINARKASFELALINSEIKNRALIDAANRIMKKRNIILEANNKDLLMAEKKKISGSFLDRLKLDNQRIKAICDGIKNIAKLEDPVGKILLKWKRPNGLNIEKVSVPLGVIGVIFESRPNVAADAAALCLKSSNATILRGGSESFNSTSIIVEIINESFKDNNLPYGTLQNIPTANRDAVGLLLQMDKYVDVVVPRGGKSLIERVTNESRVHVIKHLDGICHTYIHKSASSNIAERVLVNAKMRRPGICGATETLLIDKEVIKSHLPKIIKSLKKLNCEIRGDKDIFNFDNTIKKANKSDWETEYLDSIISIKTVTGGVEEAVDHINHFGSNHTDAIIAEDKKSIEFFLNKVDSGIVMHNTSTQFADGGEFGMGAEIGISTSKLHARGPVGVSQLTSFKYKVRSKGKIRP